MSKKRKQIRKLKKRIAQLEAGAAAETIIASEPVNPLDLWTDTTAIYVQGNGDGDADIVGWNTNGYL